MNKSMSASESDDSPLAVIAIGGNSLIRDDQHRSVLDQYNAVRDSVH